jgi:hypothetical protein
MRIWFLVAVAIVLGLAFGYGLTAMELGTSPVGTVDSVLNFRTPKPVGNGPRVVADEEEYKFGSMERESHKSHVFTVRNEGHEPLLLKKGESTCRCTKFEIGDKNLKTGESVTVNPGDSTTVNIEWHATVPPGPFRQSATIDTNDSSRPQLTFTISGDVTASHRMVPDNLVFSSILASQPHTADVSIYSYRPGQLEVTSHQFTDASTADKFEFKSEPMPATLVKDDKDANSGVILHVTVKPGLPLGEFHQKLQIHLNQLEDALELPIEGTTVSDLVIAGRGWDDDRSLLTLGTINSRDGTKAELYILANGRHRQDLHPTVKEVKPDVLKVTIGEPAATTADGPIRVPVEVEIPPGSPPMLHLGGEEGKLGNILIDTGDKDADQIRIRVRFAIGE